jgi:fibronectin type 3 domain-containing protein
MKRFFVRISLAAALLAAFLTGCDFFFADMPDTGTGNLVISLGESGGSRALSAGTLAALRYDLVLTGPGGQKIAASLSAVETFNEQVDLGEWKIDAKAYDPAGTLIGTGSVGVTVKEGGTYVTIPMYAVIDSALVAKWHLTQEDANNGQYAVFEFTAGGYLTSDAFDAFPEVVITVTTSKGRLSTTLTLNGQTIDGGSADYTVSGTELRFSNMSADAPLLSLLGGGGAIDGSDCFYKAGGNTDPKTLEITDLVITGIDIAQSDIEVGIFPTGTSPEQALSWTDIIVAGALVSDVTLSGSSVTVPLYSASSDFESRWTGSGTYDIYLMAYTAPQTGGIVEDTGKDTESGNMPRAIVEDIESSIICYRKQNVSFTTALTRVSAASFEVIPIPVPDDDVPEPPTGVTAKVLSSDSISVSWNPVRGAIGYYVYRAESASGPYSWLVSDTTATICTDREGLSPATIYYYKVSAYNSAGESSKSSYVYDKTLDIEPPVPAIPTGVTAEAQSSSSIYIKWNSVSGASGYKIYRAASASGDYSHLVRDTTATICTDSGLSPGTYYYKVSAYNSAGESSQSSYVYAKTLDNVPAAPTGVTASASSDSISVTWNSVSEASGYKIYRAASASGDYSWLVGDTPATICTDSRLSSGTYYYKVSAYNSAGESSLSSYASATISSAPASNPFIGTWWAEVEDADGYGYGYGYGMMISLTITDYDWETKIMGVLSDTKGTYSHSGNTATATLTHYWDEEYQVWKYIAGEPITFIVSGNTLTGYSDNEDPITFTKGDLTTISLSDDVWYSASLSPGDIHFYTFNAYGGSYSIFWEDFDYNNSYADIMVIAMDSGGNGYEWFFGDGHNSHSDGYSFDPSPGPVLLVVGGNDYLSSGFYRIKFTSAEEGGGGGGNETGDGEGAGNIQPPVNGTDGGGEFQTPQ